MNAKEYLQQIQKIDVMIRNKIAEAERWRDVAFGITAQSEGERVQSSGSKQKMSNAVCEYVDVEAEIRADIQRLTEAKNDVIHTIEQLPVKEYDLLHKIYVQYMEFYEAATALDRSYTWITTVHGRALQHLQKILNERGRNVLEKEEH